MTGKCSLCTEHYRLEAWASTSEGTAPAKFFHRSRLAHGGLSGRLGQRANRVGVRTRPRLAANEPDGHWRQRNGVVDSVTVRQGGGDQRQHLAPVFARPGASPRSRCFLRSRDRPRCRARVAGMISPALATKRLSSKAMHMWTGLFGGSILYPDFGPRQ